MRWTVAAAVGSWVAFTPATAADDAAFAVQVPITPAPGASLQRVEVPARVLAASRAANLADLRVFDAQGRSLPIARSTRVAAGERRSIHLDPLPILGPSGALAVSGVSLRIENGREGVVRLEGSPAPTPATTLLGTLFDTRGARDPADGLTLDVALPRGQPIAFTVAASDDLANWQPLATRMLYRANAGSGSETIAFPPADLRGRYLRVTWDTGTRLASPVEVRGGALSTLAPPDPARLPRAVIRTRAEDAHAIAFTLPFTAPVAALEIAATGDNTIVPVRILGRDNPERPWTPIADGSVFRIVENGRERRNPPFDLSGTTVRSFRIEADARTPGFAEPPAIAVRFVPVTLLFLAGGTPPYRLAAGQAGATAGFLPPESLIPGYRAETGESLPYATVAATPDPVVEGKAAAGSGRRDILLWAVLLGATALLAAMVWLLLRQRPASEATTISPPS